MYMHESTKTPNMHPYTRIYSTTSTPLDTQAPCPNRHLPVAQPRSPWARFDASAQGADLPSGGGESRAGARRGRSSPKWRTSPWKALLVKGLLTRLKHGAQTWGHVFLLGNPHFRGGGGGGGGRERGWWSYFEAWPI